MKIPQDIIDRVTRETDIVEIVSEVVPLKKAGANYKGLCPFHGEKSPSFMVHPGKQIFHCFGCGEGGDVLSFLMKREHLSFVEAVERLAARLKIAIPRDPQEMARVAESDIYYKINAYAHWFFREELRKAAAVQNYVKSRGLQSETVEKYELGFAPESFDALLNFFNAKRIPLEKASELGLLKRHAESGRYYDFFRNRLMFPIFSGQGRIIGFGGRTLSGKADEAKYVNSPESPVYHKSRELYGMFQAKKAMLSTRQAVVVEGYVDTLASVQLGIANAVAPLGTSLTADQTTLLKRLSEDIVIMFDGDEAGLRAAARGFQVALSAGVHPRVAILPEGRDPGDYLRLENPERSLSDIVKEAPYAMDWMIATTLKQGGGKAMDEAKALKILSSWVDKLPDDMQKAVYRKKLAECFDISPKEFNKAVENTKSFAKVTAPDGARLSRDELLILAFMRHPEELIRVSLSELCEDFENPELAELGRFIENFYKKQETFDAALTIRRLPTELSGIFAKILACSEAYGELKLSELLQQKRSESRKKRLKQLTVRIREAELANDDALRRKLLAEKQALIAADKSAFGEPPAH